MDEVLPQLWELGEDTPSPDGDLAEAERAAVGLADRLRGWRDAMIAVGVVDGTRMAGRLHAVHADAMQLALSHGWAVVALRAVSQVDGPGSAHVPPRGRERAGGLSLCRAWVGDRVLLAVSGSPATTVMLRGVGADHLEVERAGGVRLIPWSAVLWLTDLDR